MGYRIAMTVSEVVISSYSPGTSQSIGTAA
jgi:hypothetical protein